MPPRRRVTTRDTTTDLWTLASYWTQQLMYLLGVLTGGLFSLIASLINRLLDVLIEFSTANGYTTWVTLFQNLKSSISNLAIVLDNFINTILSWIYEIFNIYRLIRKYDLKAKKLLTTDTGNVTFTLPLLHGSSVLYIPLKAGYNTKWEVDLFVAYYYSYLGEGTRTSGKYGQSESEYLFYIDTTGIPEDGNLDYKDRAPNTYSPVISTPELVNFSELTTDDDLGSGTVFPSKLSVDELTIEPMDGGTATASVVTENPTHVRISAKITVSDRDLNTSSHDAVSALAAVQVTYYKP